jgi:uncharacterized membrane protein YphA (DoxX/SURF4 family)
MNYLITTGRAFYSCALMVYGIQQLYFGTFRDVFFSPYQNHLPFLRVFAWLFGLYLIGTAALLFTKKFAKRAALVLGAVFMTLFLTTHLSYELISEPNKIYHLGLWATPLKEIALCGGAFVVAGSCAGDGYSKLNTIIPYGNLFFLLTMTCFGIGHLIYGPLLSGMVPDWCPDHLFWVYFAGVALVAAGVAIALGIRIRAVSLLLGLMIFLWFWMVHLPSAIAQPTVNRGNLPASAFDALAFSGIAIIIAFTVKNQKWISNLEGIANEKDL